MKNEPKNGGSAFPHQFEDISGNPRWLQSTGMSLRDWFAGLAMQASVEIVLAAGEERGDPPEKSISTCVSFSYEVADRMLAERQRKTNDDRSGT